MNQKEYFGFDSIKNLKNILKQEDPKKIFLVTGKKSYEKSGAKNSIVKYLENYDFIHFDNFSSIPLLDDVKKGILTFKNKKCDLVIAIGGGSVIDFAKLTNILASQDKNIVDYATNVADIEKASKPLVAIPTTSGSGSEATHFAVVYVKQKKFSVASQHILPKYSIVDPEFTKSLPPKITAISGIDALCQATESYWSVNSTPLSRSISKQSIKLILDNLLMDVKNPIEKTRLSMAKASNLAGKAINLTKTTAPHAISYPLTYFFRIPHGQAVGLTLGEFFIFNSTMDKFNATDISKLGDYPKVFSELLDIFQVSNGASAKQKIKKLMIDLDLEVKFSMFNITINDIPLILNNINYERLHNNPRKISRNELKTILISLI
jgi:alcohol dehydrogenase class IV